jgi:putative oxygen-independent coproporphyrinogen III oxidase
MNAPRFGVYIHWPYCGTICPYCDFNVYRQRGASNADLIQAIALDLKGQAAHFKTSPAETVFLGGGTPSLLSGSETAGLLAAVDEAVGITAGAEITLEANPEDAPRFADQAAAGVNRFSIGLQALRDDALKALGRRHTATDGVAAVEAAAKTGQRVSLDLIYARPSQTEAEWQLELQEALALPAEHFSLYQLTIEASTAFGRAAARGRLRVPGAEHAADFFEITQAMCAAAGAPAYEVSNHARSTAARAQHNLMYWTGGRWIGAGPGAHGRLDDAHGTVVATEAQDRPDAYRKAITQTGLGFANTTNLTREEVGDERLLMGLRIMEGVELAAVEAAWGRPLNQTRAMALVAQGLIALEKGRLRLLPPGVLVADRIALELALP